MRRYPPRGASPWEKDGRKTGSTRAWRAQRARILERDGHRCTFIAADGVRCTTTAPLEVHHLYPGPALNVPDNHLATVCRRHNPRGANA